MKPLLFIFSLLFWSQAFGQTYTSYFTGNSTDSVAVPTGGICMMGGASEHNEAMRWFLRRANGGDILVLRASGSDGYNNYMYSQLGVVVNSVETIVFNDPVASFDTYIHQKIKNAEAIWFAGGDQWDYVSYWRNTPIDSLINDALQNRNIVIGGTSAGMAILGGFYFSAKYGSVTSATALADPYNIRVTVDSTTFLKNAFLEHLVTDTHYDDPNRKGRHMVFLARILTDYGVEAKGIACNEYTAVCIDSEGLARVYGDYPAYPETAFFLQTNCEISPRSPETCVAATPLNWNLNGKAIRVYKVNGTNNGQNTFDLSDWETGDGGSWENWYIDNGTLIEAEGIKINCSGLSVSDKSIDAVISIYPNPTNACFQLEATSEMTSYSLYDLKGKLILTKQNLSTLSTEIDLSAYPSGLYMLQIKTADNQYYHKVLLD